MHSSSPLPIEIVEQIIKHLCDGTPHQLIVASNSSDTLFPDHSSKKNLLALRLVARSWACAIPRFVYGCLTLKSPWVTGFVIKMWTDCVVLSDMFYISHLCLDQVLFFPPVIMQGLNTHYGCTQYARLDFEYQHIELESIFMGHAADIVFLCGSNLADLRLNFTYLVGFSNDFITAIRHVKSLKKLYIQGTRCHNLMNDSDSISAVLSSVPSLESLSLDFATLDYMTLEPGCLPNLSHFWISNHPNNLDAVINFVRTEGKGIKILEYMPMDIPDESFRIFLPLSQSVESVFLNSIPDDINEDMRLIHFPNLRIVRCRYVNASFYLPTWLRWPLFEKVEVFIANYWENKYYCGEVLLELKNRKWIMPPGLKHFIFIT